MHKQPPNRIQFHTLCDLQISYAHGNLIARQCMEQPVAITVLSGKPCRQTCA